MAQQSSNGIIRTASGRQTYLPDGLSGPSPPHLSASTSEDADVEKAESTYESDERNETNFMPIHPARRHHRQDTTMTVNDNDDEKFERQLSSDSSLSKTQSRGNIDARDLDELNQIATSLTRSQTVDSQFLRGDGDDLDPRLQPGSPQFDIYRWIKIFFHSMNSTGVKTKRAGFVFKDLSVSGSGAAVQLQQTVSSILMAPARPGEFFSFGHKQHKQILSNFNGVVKSGELLIVLGRPGSGCSTFLKSISGELHGISMSKESEVHYNGIPQAQMMKEYRGEVVYNQEVDKHFPHLTVGETLEFAAAARTPAVRVKDISRKEHIKLMSKVIMAVFGLSHTNNTKVGSDFVRGVSGGERKRVSIAEMALAGSPISHWDNSTRGLDSATALKFVQSLRMAADVFGTTSSVAIYQASQAIYDEFDKAIVLYEGKQIYFGPSESAKAFFEKQGWYCPSRQTTGDFLTSITNPSERKARDGMEDKVPRTSDDFAKYWQNSAEYKANMQEIADYENEHPRDGQTAHDFQETKTSEQVSRQRKKSPYLISVPMQVKLCIKRAYQRIWNDKSSTLATIGSQIVMALIIGSVFYGTPDASVGFFAKGAVLFFAILLNALLAINEINSLYSQRPIVEKHASYAFYHPATEAIAGIVSDIPVKFMLAVAFNIILYFMAGLRREPSQFFIFFLIVFVTMFVMSAVFRTMAALTKTVSQAMALAGVMVLALVIYTGFVLPVPQMHPWFSWIRFINPVFYAFEILVANEFHGRQFTCSAIVPAYTPLQGDSWICSVAGAVAGQTTVSGDAFIQASYEYTYAHVWRNFGILIAFLVGFMIIYFIATELNSSTTSTAEVLVFRRGHVPAYIQNNKVDSKDEEMAKQSSGNETSQEDEINNAIPPQKDVFTWRDVSYDIKIKGQGRRLLDEVSGFVVPGTLTALMGVSGAGKTTLLDVLAQRTTMGVISGNMFVNGAPLDDTFQRKTGYVQQQDLHLETATVRESLQFSAMLRQPKTVSKKEKYAYVEDVIKMLNMQDFAEAVVGVPGEGLNVEQRKLLTIGVELAAKPKLLLFLDEPTSGLDSQSSWAIVAFLRKLADAGQAVLCTIHQPSAILFQEFDRLLFLAKGGKTVYFGEVGKNSRTLLDYFESHGARKCDDEENPAEYMLEVVNKIKNSKGEDWFDVWKNSEEAQGVYKEIDRIHEKRKGEAAAGEGEEGSTGEFAMPFTTQLQVVTHRVFQQYWRMPSYVFAKWLLGVASSLFIGFSFFQPGNSQQGAQSIIFSSFMISTIFSTLVQQIMPLFVTQRSLYEVRERPSKAYSWKAFIIANIFVEIPYQIVLGVLVFACYYFPIVGIQSSIDQFTVLIYLIQFFIYASSFAHMCIAALPDAQTAASVVTLLFALSLVFNGVMQSPTALPGFWIFMYRVSPFTYWIGGIASTEGHGREINCSATETSIFNPPAGQTCGQYMAAYLTQAPGTLQNPSATTACQYCALSNTDQFLAGSNIYYSQRWRNFGLVWAYVLFNIFVAVVTYYLFRVRKSKGEGGGIKGVFAKFKGGFGKPTPKTKKAEEEVQQPHRPF